MTLRDLLPKRRRVRPVLVLEDADFQRLADSKRHERLSFLPVNLPAKARKGGYVYAEGTSRKTVESDGRHFRLGAVIHEIEQVIEAGTNHPRVSVVLEATVLMLTDEDLKHYPRPVHIQPLR